MMQWRIEVPCVNGDADRIRGVNHELTDFFLVWAASHFTLQRFDAQIIWRAIRRNILLNRIAYCQSDRLLILLLQAGKEIKSFSQKVHVQTVNNPGSPNPRHIAAVCHLHGPPLFSLPTNLNAVFYNGTVRKQDNCKSNAKFKHYFVTLPLQNTPLRSRTAWTY